MNIQDHRLELSQVAEPFDINMASALDVISKWDGCWKNDISTSKKSDLGRVSLISSMKSFKTGTSYRVSFSTKKHGGQSASWSYFEKNSAEHRAPSAARIRAANFQAKRSKEKEEEKEEEKKAYAFKTYYKEPWNKAPEGNGTHPYLVKKGITDLTFKVIENDGQNKLLVPMSSYDSKIIGFETIADDEKHTKKVAYGSKTFGAHFIFGEVNWNEPEQEFYLAEGMATGERVHKLTKRPVIVCFSVNGLVSNLKCLEKIFDKKDLARRCTIAADNDMFPKREGTPNSGILTALGMSKRYGVKVRFPNFDEKQRPEPGKKGPSDWWDFDNIYGTEAAQRAILRSKESILRAQPDPFAFSASLLEYMGKSASRLIPKTITIGLRKGVTERAIIEVIHRSTGIEKGELKKTYDKRRDFLTKKADEQHTCDRKAESYAQITGLLEQGPSGRLQISADLAKKIEKIKGIVIVKTAMGSGKTENLMKPLLHSDSVKTAAYMAHRIMLVEEASKRLDIACYRNITCQDQALSYDKIATCLDSTVKDKFGSGKWFESLDLLCIDEATKVVGHMNSSTMENRTEVFDNFITAIESAKTVVMCDADANNYLIEFCERFLPNTPITIAQAPIKMDVDIHYGEFESAYKKILECADRRETMLIACDSKSDVQQIHQHLKGMDLKTLAIYNETRGLPDCERWIKDVNNESKRWDVVVYNSCVDSGVSITVDHFQHTIGAFRGIVDPLTIVQMMGRNRRAKTWTLGLTPLQATAIDDSSANHRDALKACDMKTAFMKGESVKDPSITDFDDYRVMLREHGNKLREDFFLTTELILEQKGCRIHRVLLEEDLKKGLKQEIKEEKSLIAEELYESIQSSYIPSDEVYQRLKRADYLTKDEIAQKSRYEISNSIGVDEPGVADIDFWTDNRGRKECQFEILKVDEKELSAFDSEERKRTRDISMRKNLRVKGDMLNDLFSILSVDKETGDGAFTHKECRKFCEYLTENKFRVKVWNYYKMGHAILGDRFPNDVTKFVSAALKKLGLKTEQTLSGEKRLSMHQITADSWTQMDGYYKLRQKAGLSIVKSPKRWKEEDKEAEKIDAPKVPTREEVFQKHVDNLSCKQCGNDDKTGMSWDIEWWWYECYYCFKGGYFPDRPDGVKVPGRPD